MYSAEQFECGDDATTVMAVWCAKVCEQIDQIAPN
jgi:hypothetical protein